MYQEEKYGLVIIGGGPATVKFLFNLLRTSKLPDYLNLNICILEKQKTFGSGNYENKITYSNCSANEILKLMYFHNSNQMMSICKELTETQVYKSLQQYGDKNPPKSLVGYFMRLMGNALLKHIYALKKQMIFKPDKDVISLRLQSDGWLQVRLQNLDAPIKEKYKSIRAKSVLICTGKKQLFGEQFLTEKVFIENLPRFPLLIGGSGQTAFECAELLLNGPIMYVQQEQLNGFTQKIFTCPLCKSLKCGCFGLLTPLKYQWHTTDVVLPEYQQGQMKINYKVQPRVFFQNHDNDYLTIPPLQVNQQGQANYLSGLRGKAKQLFLKILATNEPRVKLQQSDQAEIDAYQSVSNDIEIRDTEGNIIQFSKFLGVNVLDNKNRLKTEKGSVRNLFAYGSCCITNDQYMASNERERTEPYLTSTLSFEDSDIMYIQSSDPMLPWFDNNEFPLTAQSNMTSKGDFDSDQSVHSEVVETETVALNSIQESLKRKKK